MSKVLKNRLISWFPLFFLLLILLLDQFIHKIENNILDTQEMNPYKYNVNFNPKKCMMPADIKHTNFNTIQLNNCESVAESDLI